MLRQMIASARFENSFVEFSALMAAYVPSRIITILIARPRSCSSVTLTIIPLMTAINFLLPAGRILEFVTTGDRGLVKSACWLTVSAVPAEPLVPGSASDCHYRSFYGIELSELYMSPKICNLTVCSLHGSLPRP